MSGSQRVSLLVLSFQRNPESPEVLKTVYRNLRVNLEDAVLVFRQRRHVSTPAPEWSLTSELGESKMPRLRNGVWRLTTQLTSATHVVSLDT